MVLFGLPISDFLLVFNSKIHNYLCIYVFIYWCVCLFRCLLSYVAVCVYCFLMLNSGMPPRVAGNRLSRCLLFVNKTIVVCTALNTFISLSVCQFTYLFICLFIYLCIYLFIYLFIIYYLFIHFVISLIYPLL